MRVFFQTVFNVNHVIFISFSWWSTSTPSASWSSGHSECFGWIERNIQTWWQFRHVWKAWRVLNPWCISSWDRDVHWITSLTKSYTYIFRMTRQI